ncbi:MAG: YceI family protein [Proteobacteria bacterium]|nr:YceI family protein [Pseudomonadota bacterium]
MQNKQLKLIAIALILLTILSACQQKKISTVNTWKLNSAHSTISIISTKNNTVSEVFEFKSFSGHIKNNYLTISIDLNSLETNIPIRNERMQKYLFTTEIFATADIHTQLKPSDLTNGIHKISFDVDLHGVSGIIVAEFMVLQQDKQKIVTLHKPLIINAATFGLEQGITTLKNIVKLDSINFTVPVNFVLTFDPI